MKIVGTTKLHVEPSRCDVNGNAPLTYLVDVMLQAATKNAAQNGFGFDWMDEIKRAWVISRMGFYVNRYPIYDEEVEIRTWVSSVDMIFTRRNFDIVDGNGYSLVQGQSFWAAIDKETRRPCDLTEMGNGRLGTVVTSDPDGYAVPRLKKLRDAAGEVIEEYMPAYSDIDLNGHFNSVKYMEHAVNLFSDDLLSGKEIKGMEVVFQQETRPGTRMGFIKDGSLVDIINMGDGSRLCRLDFKID